MEDLHKYSRYLPKNNIASKYVKSSLGKDIPKVEERKPRLVKNSYLYKLMKVLKQSDWFESPIYH